MKRYILAVAIGLMLLLPNRAAADDQLDASFYLMRLVNQARIQPMAMLKRIGIDPQKAREALGADAWVLDTGLPPLAWNPSLYQSATGHMNDMLQHAYYAYDSLDGRQVSDRIAATGYQATETGESLGAIAFAGYVDPMQAAAMVFFNMVSDEMTPGFGAQRNIFSPRIREMGIGFLATHLDLGPGLPQNVYIVVADFAQPVNPVAQLIGNVYWDANHDGLISPNEVRAGVAVFLVDLLSKAETQVDIMPFGTYQVALPWGFWVIEARNAAGQVLASRSVFPTDTNQLIDLPIAPN
jgi:hypothetical protein